MTRISRLANRIQLFSDYEDAYKAREITAGAYSKKNKCWEYPLASIPEIVESFPSAELDTQAQEVLDYVNKVNHKVEGLCNHTIVPRPHKFLMLHQRMCLDIAKYHNRFAFYCDVGTGKTILGYAIMQEKIKEKWLVICPKSIIKSGWIADKNEFFPDLKVLPITNSMRKADYLELAEQFGVAKEMKHVRVSELPTRLIEYADIVITNPELFKSKTYIEEWKHNGIIVDESSMLRNKDTATTKRIVKHSTNCKYTYLLSGKPAPNSPIEYFPQMLIVNRAIFGNNYYKFRDRYFYTTDYFQTSWELKSGLRESFTQRLARGCVFVNKHECLDLPAVMPPIMRMVEMTAEASKYYKEMEKTQVLLLTGSSNKTIMASTSIAALLKLRQITSGCIIDTDDGGAVSKLHSSKLNELKEVILELGDNKAVIWINFRFEVDDICEMLCKMGKTYVTAYGGTANVDDSIEAFKNDTAQFIIAHPQTLKYGITFTGKSMAKNCTYTIYYSMSYSYEDYYQSYHRIYRKGQTEPCTYIYLLCEGTIDEIVFNAIVKKGTDAAIIEDLIAKHSKEVVKDERVPTPSKST